MQLASDAQPPACKHCETAMKLVGKLPRIQHRPEVRVFRCYACNHVAAEEV